MEQTLCKRFETLWETLVKVCEEQEIEEYELYYSDGSQVSCETFRDELSGFSSGSGGTAFFRCLWQGRMGYVSTQLLTEQEMKSLPVRAKENALVCEKEDAAVIYDGRGEYRLLPEMEFTLPSAAELREQALAGQKTLYALGDDVSDGTTCGAFSTSHEMYLYNSKGLRLHTRGGSTGVYYGAMLKRGEEKQSGYRSSRHLPNEEERTQKAREAYDKAAARFGAGLVPSGKYDLIIDGRCMESILGTFLSVFFAENCQKNLSALKKEQVGSLIAAPCVTLVDTPFYEENPMKIAFDGEGVPTREKKLIENGVLKTLLYNLTSAKKDGVESTGNASRKGSDIGTKVFTLYLEPGASSDEALLAKADGGIYVTGMKGFHAGANTTSGDFSIESEGFLIENGKKGRPVKSFTVAGNFFTLLKSIEEVGAEREEASPGYSQIIAPAVLLRSQSVAGT